MSQWGIEVDLFDDIAQLLECEAKLIGERYVTEGYLASGSDLGHSEACETCAVRGACSTIYTTV